MRVSSTPGSNDPELLDDDTVRPIKNLAQGEAACIRADSRHMVLPDGPMSPTTVSLSW